MKKLIGVISVVFALTLFSISSVAVYSDITDYEEAPGGAVESAADLINALGGKENAEEQKSGAIVLRNNIVLKSPVVIKEGSYTIKGDACFIYRGFDGDALIKLENGASLTLEKDSSSEYGKGTIELTINGDSGKYPNGGSLISLSGDSKLTVNSNVLFKNASSSGYGGAIYASENSSVTLTNCGFENCTSLLGGGAVAFYSDKFGSEGGKLTASGVSFTDNKSENETENAKGGAIYVRGGNFDIKNCVFEKNSADIGGAIWACSKGTVSDCNNVQYNKANVSGGVICVASDGEDMIGEVILSGGSFMYNFSDGNGGFASNFGAMIISGSLTYISENTAASDGGAVYNEGSLAFTEGMILCNTSGYRGGGICSIGSGSVLVMSGGEINSNKGLFGAGVFCQGTFAMSGGTVYYNISDEPCVAVYRNMELSGSAVIGETIALCINGDVVPSINITGELTSGSGFKVMFVSEKTDKNGRLSRYSVENSVGNAVITGDVKNNADKFDAVSSFFKYKINAEGEFGMSFPFFPTWIWICVLVILILAAGAVFYFKVGKKLIADKIAKIKNKDKV